MQILEIATLLNMPKSELERMTKGELIEALVSNQNSTTCTKSIDGPNGQVLRELVTRDAAGAVLKTERWDWTYKQTGEVDEIRHVVMDEKGAQTLAEKLVHANNKVTMATMTEKEVSDTETLIKK
jgi:TusA-related sulfurtransferase